MATNLTENNPPPQRPKFLRIWLVALIGIFLIVAFGYYQYRLQQESFANTNYFRVLSEATSQLNENLGQLISLYEWDESEANIRAILPSYKSEALISTIEPSNKPERCSRSDETGQQKNHFTYEFDGQQFLIHPKGDAADISQPRANDSEKEKERIICASVASEDILPVPNAGFSLFLFVNQSNNVIASSGEQSALSIINVGHISRLIAEEQNLSWQDLTSNKNPSEPLEGQKLPGFNHYLDLQLTAGEYRIFIYPYQLSNQSKLEKDLNKPLYVLGVLPKPMLKAQQSQRWNLSLLSITLVVLVFAWVMSRLFMLSNNQPVGDTFYYLTMACSYLLFVMILALLFSYGEKSVEQEYKKTKAKQLLTRINHDFDQEVGAIIFELDQYRKYYRTLIIELQNKNPEITLLTTQLLQIKKELEELAPQLLQKEKTEKLKAQNAKLKQNQIEKLQEREALARPLFQIAVNNIPNLAKQQKEWSYSSLLDVYRDISAPENFELSSTITDNNLLSYVNFFAFGLQFIPSENYAQWLDPSTGLNQHTKILNTLLLNKNGSDNTPTFFFIESNKKPTSYQLAHRQYFRNIRDQKGWNAEFGPFPQPPIEQCGPEMTNIIYNKVANNFYIQRLLNLNNGTRGSTIAMPLYDKTQDQKIQSGKSNITPDGTKIETVNDHSREGYVMVADIALPSLTMTEFTDDKELLDMTFMVVDRDSGQVLFHLDEDRTLVENLFSFGQGTEKISHRIRAGLGGKSEWVEGFYHGIAGAFSYQKMPIDKWALVIFMPDESLDIFMTNLFLFNSITLTIILILFALGIVALRRFDLTGSIKQKLSIPLVIERRKIMVFSSIYIASIYLGVWLGSALDRANATEPYYLYLLTLLAVLTCLAWGYYEYQRFYGRSRQAQRRPINSQKGAAILTLFYLGIGTILTPYLQQVSMAASSSLNWYYTQKLYPARLNQERQELHNVALSRYPNSISRFNVDPLSLMPISEGWRETLTPKVTSKTYMQPKDVQHFGKLVNTSDLQSWRARYLDYEWGKKTENEKFKRIGNLNPYLFIMIISFLLLCGLWVRFNRLILATRLFGSPEFLRHLNQIVNRQHKTDDYYPDKALVIDLDSCPTVGHNIALLLQQWQTEAQHLPPLFSDIFILCPSLVEIASQDNPFPNMKISLEDKTDCKTKNLALTLWDIEMSLEVPTQRKLLLRFVNHLKSLKLAGHITSVTIVSEFHSLQRLCLKDTLLSSQGKSPQQLEQREYFSWAECLMDFSVKVPRDLKENLNLEFIQQEVNAFPMLEFLRDDLNLPKVTETNNSFNLMRWINLNDWQKTHTEWASINYILLKAEALYRFKWETCSAAEKLALFYLARNKRMNPANLQMLEHLALNGLIKIKRGRIRIANKSFAYFVQYAEDKETLHKMVAEGNLGKWQDYRLPVTLLILLIIGTIALTSGNSLYMIVASAMGVLGTIGSLTNSANLIRNNMQE
jgi:hypothetical protein